MSSVLNEQMLMAYQKMQIINLATSSISDGNTLDGDTYHDPEHHGEFALDRVLHNIHSAQLCVFKPEKSNGIGILVIPGGGYHAVMIDKEGTALAPWFLARGYTLFVLSYRMPLQHPDTSDRPLIDAIRAMKIIRKHADRWGLNPQSIGVLGFSAGGHLAASLATRYQEAGLSDDVISARPDFLALIYPVISMRDDIAHVGSRGHLLGESADRASIEKYSPDLHVKQNIPPVFLLHAIDDREVSVENSLVMFSSLKKQGASVELHLFEKGGHGFGVQWTEGLPVAIWPDLFTRWLANKMP